MTCSNTREYMFAFLDNELDAPLSIELQRHLDGCPGCAREAEIERTIRKRLGAAINTTVGEAPDLDTAFAAVVEVATEVTFPSQPVGQAVQPGQGSQPVSCGTGFPAGRLTDREVGSPAGLFHRGRRLLATAAAILLVLGAGLWFAFNSRIVGVGSPRFADLVVRDFEHFLDEGATVQLASADGIAVAEWLHGKTGLAVVLPAGLGPQCRLAGGRKCSIDGRPAAFAVYYMKDTPVSLLAVAAEENDLPGGRGSSLLEGMTEVRGRGVTHWVDHCEDYTVVACRRSGLVYAAVSTLGEEELLSLMTDR